MQGRTGGLRQRAGARWAGFASLLFALQVVEGWVPTRGAEGSAVAIGPFQRGMVLGVFSKSDPEYFRRNLKEMQDLGVNSVSLIVPKVQKDIRSIGFFDDRWVTPSDASLRLAIREAHRRGMRAFLLPIVYVEELQEGEWRGTLAPADWDGWFREYEAMIAHYARLAAEERVEYFSVGSELCSTEGMTQRWKRVIRKVRGIYPGLITYSANWDHLDPVSFADSLDFLGMNAYYEVGRGTAAEVETMVHRWSEIQKGIRSWRKANGGKPLVITEVGYPSRTGAAVDPWNYLGQGEPAPDEQRKCFEAFFRAWKGETMLAGVYFYLWWGEGGPRDTNYTPRGKPAQDVIAAWYNGEAGKGGSAGPQGVR